MTRSLSCALRGMFAESWFYHPLGLPVLVLFIFIAAQSLFPADVRERLSALIRRRAMVFNVAYMLFVTSFMSFGVARALLNLRQLELLAILHSPV